MKELFQAIMTAFNADPPPELHNLLSGRLFFDHAPQGERAPFAVMSPIAGTNFDTFSTRITNLRFQVSLFSAQDSSAECWNLCRAATGFFEKTDFAVNGCTVRLIRIMEPLPRRGGERLWAAHGDYRALIQDI